MPAYGCTGQRPYYGASGCAFYAAVYGRFVCRCAADLSERVMPAIGIVGAKLVETLA
jgi:hypothetical protein